MTLSGILSGKGRDTVTVAPHRTLREIVRMLHEKSIGAVVITGADGGVLGIFSERDLVHALGRHGSDVLDDAVSRHMTARVVTATEDMTVNEAMERMTDGRFRHIPVVDHGRLAGLVSIGDVVKYRIAEIEHERQQMLAYIGDGLSGALLPDRPQDLPAAVRSKPPVEARAPAGVTDPAVPAHPHREQQGVLVAVHLEVDQPLHLSRRVALAPEGLAGARPVMHRPRIEGQPQGARVHVGDHQERAVDIGGDADDQARRVEARLEEFGLLDRFRGGDGRHALLRTDLRAYITRETDGQPLRSDGPAMLSDIYNDRILDLAGNIPRIGRLAAPDASATAHSKLCGSTVTVDVVLDDGVVTDFAHEVRACALGQASSSIMARHVVGARVEDLRGLRDAMRRMLKDNGSPPQGDWADCAVLEPIRDYKARHASTLLTFEAVVDAIEQAERRQGLSGRRGP